MSSSYSSLLLLALIFQRSGTTVILHEAGTRQPFSSTVAVFFGELVKQLLCFVIAIIGYEGKGALIPTKHDEDLQSKNPVTHRRLSFRRATQQFVASVLNRKAFVLIAPAALYVAQNNLCLIASANLQPSIFQAAWQLRLMPTALLSHFMLRKRISAPRWLALVGILLGVLALQAGQHTTLPHSFADLSPVAASGNGSAVSDTSVKGFSALMAACTISGLASILLERVFVQKDTNLWVANFQLSSFSLIPAGLLLMSEAGSSASPSDPFRPFAISLWPWTAVVLQSLIGILVSLTTKHAGAVVNCLAGVASIAVTYLVQVTMNSAHQTKEQHTVSLVGLWIIISCTAYFQWPQKATH